MNRVIVQEGKPTDFSNEYVAEQKIYNFIKKSDKDFPERLSDRVDLKEYSNKLFDSAVIITQINDDEIVGMFAGYANDESKKQAYVTFVSVDKEYRGHGIGQKLLSEFIIICKRKGFSKIMLHTSLENKNAISLYEKNGFERGVVSGKRVEYIYTIKE